MVIFNSYVSLPEGTICYDPGKVCLLRAQVSYWIAGIAGATTWKRSDSIHFSAKSHKKSMKIPATWEGLAGYFMLFHAISGRGQSPPNSPGWKPRGGTVHSMAIPWPAGQITTVPVQSRRSQSGTQLATTGASNVLHSDRGETFFDAKP